MTTMTDHEPASPPAPASEPVVWFVVGPAGSGKSSISRKLAERSGSVYLDKDSIATAFTEFLLQAHGYDKDERDGNEFYRTAVMPLEYATLLQVCGDNLRHGKSVVLDAPFGAFVGDDGYLERVRQEHDWPPCRVVVVHVRTDGDLVRQRLIERGLDRDGWKLGHWDQFWAGAGATECQWRGADHVDLDNNGTAPDIQGLLQSLTPPTV